MLPLSMLMVFKSTSGTSNDWNCYCWSYLFSHWR
jgi:hypothetical protein